MAHGRRTSEPRLAVTVILGLLLTTPFVAADDGSRDLDVLVSWMTGSFSSAVQAADDPDYFDISLHMATIWLDRADGHWLYVEQAMRDYPNQPYRQRVYCVRELAPGLFECRVFTLPDPTAVVGAWRDENPLAELGPNDLKMRDGCSILMRRRGETFVGSTLATLCTSNLRGASYATSEVVVTADGVVSWDRGFAADGNQVWGATEGGYVLDRIVDDAESGTESVSEPEPEPEPEPDSDPVPAPEHEAEGRDDVVPVAVADAP